MGLCASSPGSAHQQAADTSKHGGPPSARRPGLAPLDLDRSARNGAAFLLRPSMHPEGASVRNPSAHCGGGSYIPSASHPRRSMAADSSTHRAAKSFSASAEPSVNRSHRGSAQCPPVLLPSHSHLLPASPHASSSNSLISPISQGTDASPDLGSPLHSRSHAHHSARPPAAGVGPTRSGAAEHLGSNQARFCKKSDKEGKLGNTHSEGTNAISMTGPSSGPCHSGHVIRRGSAGPHAAAVTRSASLACGRLASTGHEGSVPSGGHLSTSRGSNVRNSSHKLWGPGFDASAHAQDPRHERDSGIMLIADLSAADDFEHSDNIEKLFLDEDGMGRRDGDGGEEGDGVDQQSSLSSMFDETAAALQDCEGRERAAGRDPTSPAPADVAREETWRGSTHASSARGSAMSGLTANSDLRYSSGSSREHLALTIAAAAAAAAAAAGQGAGGGAWTQATHRLATNTRSRNSFEQHGQLNHSNSISEISSHQTSNWSPCPKEEDYRHSTGGHVQCHSVASGLSSARSEAPSLPYPKASSRCSLDSPLYARTSAGAALSPSPSMIRSKNSYKDRRLKRSAGSTPTNSAGQLPMGGPLRVGSEVDSGARGFADGMATVALGARAGMSKSAHLPDMAAGGLSPEDLGAMRIALELSACLGAPDGSDAPLSAGRDAVSAMTDSPHITSKLSRGPSVAGVQHLPMASPFNSPHVQMCTSTGAHEQASPSPSPDMSPEGSCQCPAPQQQAAHSPHQVGASRLAAPANSGSLSPQVGAQALSSISSPKLVQRGSGRVISPKGSTDAGGLVSSFGSLRSLGNQIFKPHWERRSLREPVQHGTEQFHGPARKSMGVPEEGALPKYQSQHTSQVSEAKHATSPASSGDMKQSMSSLPGCLPVGSSTNSRPITVPAASADCPGRGSNHSTIVAHSLDQWAAAGSAMSPSSPALASRSPGHPGHLLMHRQLKQQLSSGSMAGSPGSLGPHSGTLARDADELVALSFFSRAGSSSSGPRPARAGAAAKSASVHGGCAYTAPGLTHAPLPHSGSLLLLGTSTPSFSTGPLSPRGRLSQPGAQPGSFCRPSHTPPTPQGPSCSATPGSTGPLGSPRKPVSFGSQHGGSAYRDWAAAQGQQLGGTHGGGSAAGAHEPRTFPQVAMDMPRAPGSRATSSPGMPHTLSAGDVHAHLQEGGSCSPPPTMGGPPKLGQASIAGQPHFLASLIPDWLEQHQHQHQHHQTQQGGAR